MKYWSHYPLYLSFYPKNYDRQAWANSVDPDQMPRNAASDKRLYFCVPLSQQILDTSEGSEIELFRC